MTEKGPTMTNDIAMVSNKERPGHTAPGGVMLAVNIGLMLTGLALIVYSVFRAANNYPLPVDCLIAGVLLELLGGVSCGGFFTLQPNTACVLILFGAYKGTVRTSGFHWTNPFMRKMKISLRARNLNGEKLKVNDKGGNPIEIAAVVVWRVSDTTQAVFDVQDYDNYVRIQSESAVRHLANSYA